MKIMHSKERKKIIQKKNEENMAMQQYPTSALDTLKDSEITLKGSDLQFGTSYLELDEAFDYAGIRRANGDDGSKIENSFTYEKATHIGHGAEGKLPVLFELYQYENKFQKVLSLEAVFESMQIASCNANSKHVLLHFNVDNDMPKLALKLLDLKRYHYQVDIIRNVKSNLHFRKE